MNATHSIPWRAHAAFYLCTFVWNCGLGMSHPLIPLYADSLGMSGVAIGTLIAAPVLVQIAFNLLGGAFTDRLGGRLLVLFSCLSMCAGALMFSQSTSFAALLAAQAVLIMGRAVFWPATWTIAGQLPGARSVELGRLNAMTNLGQIAGTLTAGVAIAVAGFANAFLLLAGSALVAWVAMLMHPREVRPSATAKFAPFARYGRLLRLRPMLFVMGCAYVAALPFSLSVSFYPLLFEAYGYRPEVNGLVLSLRGIGAALMGIFVARYLDFSMKGSLAIGSAATVALAVGTVGLTGNILAVSALLLLVGLGSGLMSLNFQIMVTEVTAPEDRGSANALGGVGWGMSHLSAPLLMGVLHDNIGIQNAFVVLGLCTLAWAAALAWLHVWAFGQRRGA
ncbi:MAG: MFS transporter [Burkholderiales bacterium]